MRVYLPQFRAVACSLNPDEGAPVPFHLVDDNMTRQMPSLDFRSYYDPREGEDSANIVIIEIHLVKNRALSRNKSVDAPN